MIFGSRRPHSAPRLNLSFRADGPYWNDLVQLLAYPNDISYIWPFRYNAPRVQEALRNEIGNDRARQRLSGQPVIIGARFFTRGAENLFVPIRHATMTHVEVEAGTYSFSFRLGFPMKFQDMQSLKGCATRTSQGVDILAFREDLDVPFPATTQLPMIGDAWKAFSKLIVDETSLPINDEAKRSVSGAMCSPTGP